MSLLKLFNSYEKKKRRSHFKNLFAVASVDGDVQSAEVDLLIRLAEKFHMSTQEVTRIIKSSDPETIRPPKTPEERIQHLYDLVTVMLVDGSIDQRELALCKSFASKLGVLDNDVDPLVRDLIEMSLKGVPPETAQERALKKYGEP